MAERLLKSLRDIENGKLFGTEFADDAARGKSSRLGEDRRMANGKGGSGLKPLGGRSKRRINDILNAPHPAIVAASATMPAPAAPLRSTGSPPSSSTRPLKPLSVPDRSASHYDFARENLAQIRKSSPPSALTRKEVMPRAGFMAVQHQNQLILAEVKGDGYDEGMDLRPGMSSAQKVVTERISVRLAQVRREEKQNLDSAALAVKQAASILPTKLLVKYSMFDFIKDRGPKAMHGLLIKMRVKLLRQGMAMWSAEARYRTGVLQKIGGFLLTRVMRGCMARLRVWRIRKERADALALAEKLRQIMKMNKGERATLIQTAMRTLWAKRNFNILLKRHRSTSRLTRVMRAYKLLRTAQRKVQHLRNRLALSILVQRVWRGYRARYAVWFSRTTTHRAEFRKTMEADLFVHYFKCHGAALKIQRFLKMMRWRTQLRWKRRREWGMQFITRVYRGHVGRTITRRQRAGKLAREQLAHGRLVALQALARRFLVRCRMDPRRRLRFRVGSRRLERRWVPVRAPPAVPNVQHRLSGTLLGFHSFINRKQEHEEPAQEEIEEGGNHEERQNEKGEHGRDDRGDADVREPGHNEGPTPEVMEVVVNANDSSDRPTVNENTSQEEGRSEMMMPLRKSTVLYLPHIVLGDVSNTKRRNKLESAVALIQLQWSTFKARRWRKAAWMVWKDVCAIRMQKWATCWLWRRKVHFGTKIHHALALRRQSRWHSKVKQAIYIQRTWRAVLLRRTKGNPNRIVRLQIWWRARVNKWRFKAMIQRRRAGEELSASGAMLMMRTRVCVYQEQMWKGVTMKGFAGEVKRELQRIFSNASPQGQMELSKFTKLMRDCPGLMGKGSVIDTQRVDLMFSKVKGPNDKKLVYPKFVELLFVLGAIKFGVSHPDVPILSNDRGRKSTGKSKTGTDGKATAREEEKKKKVAKEEKKAKELVPTIESKDFRFGRLRSRAAVVCKFIDTYLSKTNDFKRASADLRSNSCDSRTEQKIQDTVRQLQRWLKTRHSIRRLNRFKNAVFACVLRSKENKAAAVIQGMGRSWLGRLMLVRLAQKMYVKYMDNEQDPPREYWFNPRTGHAMWTKPLLLRDKDCGAATKVPLPDESYEIYCNICTDQIATLRCEDCAKPYCSSCYGETHRGEGRRDHTHIEYSRCVQCDFQMSSRLCDQCEDLYCDTCYSFIHRKGRYRIHTFAWTCEKCHYCEKRAAQWKRTTADTKYIPVDVCVPCLKEQFSEDPTEILEEEGGGAEGEGEGGEEGGTGPSRIAADAMPWLQRIEYLGHSVVQHREAVAYAAKMKAIADLDELRKQIRYNRVRFEAARAIQRKWRSVALRHAPWFMAFVHQRRQFFELRELEQPIRDSPLYKLRMMIGVPMRLASDTPVEMLDMMYGNAMLSVVEEACDFDLKKAYKLAREQALWQWNKAILDVQKRKNEDHEKAEDEAKKLAEKARLEKEQRMLEQGSDYSSSEEEEEEEATPTPTKNHDDTDEDTTLLEHPAIEFDKVNHKMHQHEDLEGLQPGQEIGKLLWSFSDCQLYLQVLRARLAHRRAEEALERQDVVLRDVMTQYDVLREEEENALSDNPAAKIAFMKKMARNTGPVPQVRVQIEILDVARETLGKASEELRKAEELWIEVVGPRVLQKLVKQRQSKGFPLPFRLDFRKGSKYARVNWLLAAASMGMEEDELDANGNLTAAAKRRDDMMCPGGWQMVLRTGMHVYVKGARFKVMRQDVPEIPDYESSVYTGDDADSIATIESGDQLSLASADKATPPPPGMGDTDKIADAEVMSDVSDGEQKDNGNAGDDAESVSSSEGADTVSDEDSLFSTGGRVTQDHVRFDRVWVLEDTEGILGFLRIGKTSLQKLVDKACRVVFKQYPVQKCIQVAAISCHKLGRLAESAAKLFDEDSPSADWLRVKSAHLRVSRDKIAKFSLSSLEWSFDFSLRRKMWRAFKRTTRSLHRKWKETKRAMKNRAAAQNLTGYQEAEMMPFKRQLIVELDEPGEDLEKLGSFQFCIEETSAETLREYIQRRLRWKMNQKRIGDNFFFFEGGDLKGKDPFALPKVLKRKEEKARYAKDFITFKIDPETQDGSNYVMIQWDKKADFEPIPEADPRDDLLVEQLLKEQKAKKEKDLFGDSDSDSDDSEEQEAQVPDNVLLKQLIAEEQKLREVAKKKKKAEEAKKKKEQEEAEKAEAAALATPSRGLYG